jgi:hypothetical protein
MPRHPPNRLLADPPGPLGVVELVVENEGGLGQMMRLLRLGIVEPRQTSVGIGGFDVALGLGRELSKRPG